MANEDMAGRFCQCHCQCKGSQYSESVQFLSKCRGKVIVVRALHGRLTKYGVTRNIRSYDIVGVDEEGRRLVDGPQCLV